MRRSSLTNEVAACDAEIKKIKAELQDGEFLKNTFKTHKNFDSFAKEFGNADGSQVLEELV